MKVKLCHSQPTQWPYLMKMVSQKHGSSSRLMLRAILYLINVNPMSVVELLPEWSSQMLGPNHPNILMFYGLCRPIPLLTLQNSIPPKILFIWSFAREDFLTLQPIATRNPFIPPKPIQLGFPSSTHPRFFPCFFLLLNIPAMKVDVCMHWDKDKISIVAKMCCWKFVNG